MKDTLLDVKGMHCGSCVRHIDKALSRIDGVKQVEVRLRDGRVLVRHEEAVEAKELVTAVEDAGYDASMA